MGSQQDLIVFIATAWGARFGGINTFNKDLVVAMASILPEEKYRVVCVTLDSTPAERASADLAKVTLLSIGNPDNKKSFSDDDHTSVTRLLRDEFPDSHIIWWIGHDLITGPLALKAKADAPDSHCAIIRHTNNIAYSREPGEKVLEINKVQNSIIRDADVAFGVGPRLTKTANYIRNKSGKSNAVQLLPGMPHVDGSQDPPPDFSALTFGRMDASRDRNKNGRLAAAAFASAVGHSSHFGYDAHFTLIGLHPESEQQDHAALLELMRKYGNGKVIQTVTRSYWDKRSELFEYLTEQSVCLMLSQHEGFGLVGWETIAAEVPLIITKNSGLYDLLHDSFLTDCVYPVEIKGWVDEETPNEHDITTIVQALETIKTQEPHAKRGARHLKSTLKAFTWDNTALKVATALSLDYSARMTEMFIWSKSPGLAKTLADGKNVVATVIPKRELSFDALLQNLKEPSPIDKRVVLFGGIATTLCTEEARTSYCNWLASKPNSHFFVCYESGPGGHARAQMLNQQVLDDQQGLPIEPEMRMSEKEKRTLKLQEDIQRYLKTRNAQAIKRVHFIPLPRPLTFNAIIADNDIYFTPIFEKRSSETMDLHLSPSAYLLRAQIVDSIKYNITDGNDTVEAQLLLKELDDIMNGDLGNDLQQSRS